MEILQIVSWTFFSGVLSLLGGILLLLGKKDIDKYETLLTSFAAGVLLTLATTDFMPEVFDGSANQQLVGVAVLIGTLFLFAMEKSSIWWHHHHQPHVGTPTITGLMIGDTVHNFMDGVAIAAGFMVGHKIGVATAIGVMLHELPQEIADFGLCLRAGLGKTKTFLLNLLSSLAAILGGVLTVVYGRFLGGEVIYIMAATAGMFLYIALADLIPELHREHSKKAIVGQVVVFGIGTLLGVMNLFVGL